MNPATHLPKVLTFDEILAKVEKMKPKIFTMAESYYNAMIFISGKMTVFYDIKDVPEDIEQYYKGVIEKNKLAIINDHF